MDIEIKIYINLAFTVAFADLGVWIPSIQNQLWWSFSSSVGNVAMLREKLDSVTEHMVNVHSFPENQHFRQCGHGLLFTDEEREKAWLSPDSLVKKNY